MRVLHLPSSTGGNAWNLSMAERSLGITSRVLVLGQTYFGFKADICVDWTKNKYTYPIRAWKFYNNEMDNYDIFHFNFGRTLFDYRWHTIDMLDLPWLKRKNKRIVVTYQGTDARLAQFSLENYDTSYYHYLSKEELQNEKKADQRKRDRFNKVNKYADLIYTTNPDLKNVLPERTIFRPYTKIQIEDWTPVYSDYSKEELIIAHAPTNRAKKGTDIILNTVERLKQAGIRVRLDLIENMSNDETVNRLRQADLVIDQIFIGWYGGLAVESMALGKPVVAFIRESDMVYIPPEMDASMPIIRVTPENIEGVLADLLVRRGVLEQTARQSRAYVEQWHDSKAIAARIIDDYRKIL